MADASPGEPPPPPFCCLFKEGAAWRERLVLAELKADHWLSLDSDWCWREDGLFSGFDLHGAAAFFGDPKSAGRFAGAAAAAARAGEACDWLRTSAGGAPRPGRGRSRWCKGSAFAGLDAPDAGDEVCSPRGAGDGAIGQVVVEQLMRTARQMRESMMEPDQFLHEALDTWQALAFHFQRAIFGARGGGAGHGAEPAGSEDAPETRDFRARRLQSEVAEAALSRCWPLLTHEQRCEFMATAADDIGRGLCTLAKDFAQSGRDVECISRSGLDGLLSRACAEMSTRLAERSRVVQWDASIVGTTLLAEFERQVGLARVENVMTKSWGEFRFQALAPEESVRPVPFPTTEHCVKLQAWNEALGHVAPRRAGGEPAAQPGALLGLPATAQCHVAGYAVPTWRDFGSVAAACVAARRLCFAAATWRDVALRVGADLGAERPPISATPYACLRRPSRAASSARRAPQLSQRMVTWLRLGLSAFSPERPLLLEPGVPALDRIVRECRSRARGFAYSWRLPCAHLAEGMRCAVRAGSDADAALRCFAPQARRAAGAARSAACRVPVPPRPARGDLGPGGLPGAVLASRARLALVAPRLPGPGGSWYKVSFAEVAWGFQRSAPEEVRELFGLAFARRVQTRAPPPDTLAAGGTPGWLCFALSLAGAGPSRLPGARGRGPAPEPGAYLRCLAPPDEPGEAREGAARDAADGQDECARVATWSLSELAPGDRLGLAHVELWCSLDASGSRCHKRAVGLAFVHNGRPAGGRWVRAAPRRRDAIGLLEAWRDWTSPARTSDLDGSAVLLVEAPLTVDGGELTCLPNSWAAHPPIQSLLAALGKPPGGE